MATATRKKKQPVKKAIPSGKGLTFEKVWALMQKSAEKSEREFEREKRERIEQFKQYEKERKQKEEQYEKERKQKEEQLEKERKQKEEQLEKERKQKEEQLEKERQERIERYKELDRIVRRNSKQMGELHQRFGQLAEHLVAPSIAKRFNELGYNFGSMLPKGQKIFDAKTGKMKTEIDLILENGKTILAVEVKTRPVIQDEDRYDRWIYPA
jgi:DNA repair exonuclease SbcCD ATPase subunit